MQITNSRRIGPSPVDSLLAAFVPSRPARRRGVVRERRWEHRPPVRTHLYINAMSAAPITDWEISDGAFRTLSLIVQKAGGPGVPEFSVESLETFTQSLATALGRHVRTIRNHLNELEAAGYLLRWVCRDTNRLHIRLSERLHARPGASLVPEERKIRVPPSWERPRQGKRSDRKTGSAIDPRLNLTPPAAAPEPAQEEEEEDPEERDRRELQARRMRKWVARVDAQAARKAAQQIADLLAEAAKNPQPIFKPRPPPPVPVPPKKKMEAE